MKKLIILSLFLLASCTDEKESEKVLIPAGMRCERRSNYGYDYCISKSYLYQIYCNKEKQANFIIKCAEVANPKSDEEGEDLVAECAKHAENIFCKKEYHNQPAAMLNK